MPKFVILWPGGNTTALVTDSIPRAKHAELAREIMSRNKEIEQVGYLETAHDPLAGCRLQMMGGEFCMNATRSAAYYYAKQYGLKKFLIEASGFDELIEVEIEGDITYITLPGRFYLKSTEKMGYNMIDLAGIRHLVVRAPFDEELAHAMIHANKDSYQAVGVVFVSGESNSVEINPLVWVRSTDTFVRETGCGSGSIATAIALYQSHPELFKFNVKQPSGESYVVMLDPQGLGFKTIKLSGVVKIREI